MPTSLQHQPIGVNMEKLHSKSGGVTDGDLARDAWVSLATMDISPIQSFAIRQIRVTAGSVTRITRCNIDFRWQGRQHMASRYERGRSVYSPGEQHFGKEAVGRPRRGWEVPSAPIPGWLPAQRRVPGGNGRGDSGQGRNQARAGRFGQGCRVAVAAGSG